MFALPNLHLTLFTIVAGSVLEKRLVCFLSDCLKTLFLKH